jgi:hypothetical protein
MTKSTLVVGGTDFVGSFLRVRFTKTQFNLKLLVMARYIE